MADNTTGIILNTHRRWDYTADLAFVETNLKNFRYCRELILSPRDDYIEYLLTKFEEAHEPLVNMQVYYKMNGNIKELEILSNNLRLYEVRYDQKKRFIVHVAAVNNALLDSFINSLDTIDTSQEKTTDWKILSADGSIYEATLPLKKSKPCTEYHLPWVEKNVQQFLKEYNESESPILILLGPPGTGKSSLINYYINEYNKDSIITYDQNLIKKDLFFVDYLETYDKDLLVLEDADEVIRKTSSGRSEILSKILNVGDGIVDVNHKKIIITANINSVNEIDSAISRKGRCFDVLCSRKMTVEEARALANYEQLDYDHKEPVSLAEFYNGKDPVIKKETFGFGFSSQ